MNPKEQEHRFLSRVSEYLVSLPFDLKILQEAVSDPDLDLRAREIAAGAVVHALSPQEGEPGPLRFADDALLVRAALQRVSELGGEGAAAFRDRFADAYSHLDDDIALFEEQLGDTWRWLTAKMDGFTKQTYKGKKVPLYVENDEAIAFLYDEGLEFETNYAVTEEQVRNRVRRSEQIVEYLNKRRTEEAKKIS